MNCKLLSFKASGYKAFADTQNLEIAPLTLLIGENNAGKSALARLPVLLTESLRTRSSLLNMNARDLDFGSSFQELVHGHSATGAVEFSLDYSVSGVDFRFETRLLGFQRQGSRPSPKISYWRLTRLDNIEDHLYPLEFKLEIHGDSDSAEYKATLGSREISAPSLRSLVPDVGWFTAAAADSDGLINLLGPVLSLTELWQSVHHLGPFRAVPRRLYDLGSMEPELGAKGEGAPQILAVSQLRDDSLLDKVSHWFSRHFRQRLAVSISSTVREPGIFSLDFQKSNEQISIADSGTGFAQLLPLVVRRFQLDVEEWRSTLPTLQIVEQPELHLHPNANALVGDLLVEIAGTGRCKVIAETHSENLVLRVRRRIAEGQLSPEDVALYWVEDEDGVSRARRLSIERDGTVPDWPEGIFAEDVAEARALARAMREYDERQL